jgi:hypothetical protein
MRVFRTPGVLFLTLGKHNTSRLSGASGHCCQRYSNVALPNLSLWKRSKYKTGIMVCTEWISLLHHHKLKNHCGTIKLETICHRNRTFIFP